MLLLIPSTMSDGPVECQIPQGNIERILAIRHFVVENVRTARRFLRRLSREADIDAMHFEVLDEHTAPEQVASLLAPAAEGHDIGVISEAGCPAVADPGADLVAVAQARGIEVVPLVGPSSIIMALMGSGMCGQRFAFLGYLPRESGARSAKLRDMARAVRRDGQTQIFIETPYRNDRLIAELATALPPDLKLCVAADITGPEQSIVTRPVRSWSRAERSYAHTPAIFVLGA